MIIALHRGARPCALFFLDQSRVGIFRENAPKTFSLDGMLRLNKFIHDRDDNPLIGFSHKRFQCSNGDAIVVSLNGKHVGHLLLTLWYYSLKGLSRDKCLIINANSDPARLTCQFRQYYNISCDF